MPERQELAAIAESVAILAGDLLMAGYRSHPTADEKAKRDLVTDYDRRSQELIVAQLTELTPEIAIIAEEDTTEPDSDAASPLHRGLTWCVDPLDGTTNFVHGHPFFCVSIGLICDGLPVAGSVVAPALTTRWTGHMSTEADASNSTRATRNGVSCEVSSTVQLERALVATGFPPDRSRSPQNNFSSFESVKRKARGVRRCGSAALDLCLVADGTYDGYWERRLHIWDVAAGGALVAAAGGRITNLSGARPVWDIGHLVASNGKIHSELVLSIGDVGDTSAD